MESALVRVGVSQCGPPESISKRAPSTTRTSLRLESTGCGQPNCRLQELCQTYQSDAITYQFGASASAPEGFRDVSYGSPPTG